MKQFKALGIVSGLALSRAKLLQKKSEKKSLEGDLNSSLQKAFDDLEILKGTVNNEIAEVFSAHQMILFDPEILEKTNAEILDKKISWDLAYSSVMDSYIAQFEAFEDPYFKERAADLKDIKNRVLSPFAHNSFENPSILVTGELTPSQTALLNPKIIMGIITRTGGKTSHSAIIASSLGIPYVSGFEGEIFEDDLVFINGQTGVVLVNPPDDLKEKLIGQIKEQEFEKLALEGLKNLDSLTLDGEKIIIRANMANPSEAQLIKNSSAEGVGLFRTEFLFMESPPSEEEQFQIYKKVLQELHPNPVVIRTLDAGGDKKIPYLQIAPEDNPFLGNRALRLCLKELDLFKTQLRAMIRASKYGKLKILIPFVTTLEEVIEVKKILAELGGGSYEFGIMIEIPSAALIADVLADYVDFFSIGTNDLIQYTCAVDRMNSSVAHLYDIFNPGVLKLISMVISAAKEKGIDVEVCGEAATNKEALAWFLKEGLREISVPVSEVLKIKKIVRGLKI
jgi:phosphoenolpyruvate-protein phosphotransferase (PTS system enzyme I)